MDRHDATATRRRNNIYILMWTYETTSSRAWAQETSGRQSDLCNSSVASREGSARMTRTRLQLHASKEVRKWPEMAARTKMARSWPENLWTRLTWNRPVTNACGKYRWMTGYSRRGALTNVSMTIRRFAAKKILSLRCPVPVIHTTRLISAEVAPLKLSTKEEAPRAAHQRIPTSTGCEAAATPIPQTTTRVAITPHRSHILPRWTSHINHRWSLSWGLRILVSIWTIRSRTMDHQWTLPR